MTDRILSRHGNVIAADFKPRQSLELHVTISCETLYCDGHVMLTRTTMTMGDKPFAVMHFAADLNTGTIATL